MIKSLLIANRGEIACRIIKTAQRMGIRTIAIYSEADSEALHVAMADEAHFVGPSPASESYLRAGKILKIAKDAGAEAVHPGYGFLSENADFAEMTRDAGMVFIGPSASAIREMGLKDRAKQLMSDAGVPVVPGYHGTNQTPDFLKRKAYEIGYPVLIKAVAGGGGKGMRKVMKALEFDDALDAAKREAKAAFGNDTVLIEKFAQNPRHIEIQVFGDSHGNAVHLFERDCSLQRRHQKVVEEAPAPGMHDAMRRAMGEAACNAARAVKYESAGTVEFIVDGSQGLRADGFYFMEMNTRLQVEHPVTEMITGEDLVEWQLRVANGEALPKSQEELAISGHAVEVRIYAEDADNGFLPSTGKLIALELGSHAADVRVDAGVRCGDVISPYYDPMIAKLIAHGHDRDDALTKLKSALNSSFFAGPVTNVGFLSKLLNLDEFVENRFDTSLIDQEIDNLTSSDDPSTSVLAAGLTGLIGLQLDRIAAENTEITNGSAWSVRDSFQLAGERELDWQYQLNGEVQTNRVRFHTGTLSVLDDDDQWAEAAATARLAQHGEEIFVVDANRQYRFRPFDHSVSPEDALGAADGSIKVPMHGKIIGVTVSNGDAVEKGDILFSVEAMKMEHAVIAPIDGLVDDVAISNNDQMENGAIAMRITSEG